MAKVRASFGQCDEFHYGSEISFESLEEKVLQSDCFSGKKLFILTELPSFSSSRPTFVSNFKKLLDDVPSDCLIVFNGIDPASEKAISGHVAKIGKIREFNNTVPFPDAEEEVKQLLATAGKSIEAAEATALVSSLPSEDGKAFDIDNIALTVQKLVCFMERRKNVTSDDILAISTASEYATPWQLFDAIDDKQFEKSLKLFRKLIICQGNNEPQGFVVKFLHLCMWRYKLLCFVKECQIAGLSEKQIVADTAALVKLSSVEGTGVGAVSILEVDKQPYSERQVQGLLHGGFSGSPLEKYTRKRLVAIVEFLQESIEETRKQRPDEALRFLVDVFLMLACEKIDDNRRRALMRYFDS